MPDRDSADRFDDRVQALLAGLPREAFRQRLGEDLMRIAASMPREDSMTTMTVPQLRQGFHALTPYLLVERIDEFMTFMTTAFGAVETERAGGSAGGIHIEARIGDSMLMMGGYRGMTEMPTALHLYVEDADAVYARAVAAGATTLHPLTDQPYGDREASVRDPFGNHWYIATHTASPATGHRPEGLRAVTPYLHPRGAQRMIDFLRNAFDAEEAFRHQEANGQIVHVKVKVGDSVIEMGEAHGPWQPMPGAFYLYVDDVDRRYAQALRAGGTSQQAPADQPYGDRVAYVQDPGGNIWYIATPLPPGVVR